MDTGTTKYKILADLVSGDLKQCQIAAKHFVTTAYVSKLKTMYLVNKLTFK